MTQSLPPNAAPLKLLRATKVTAPAPVRLRRSTPSNNNGNSNIKPSLNPHRASYPSAALPTVTENRSLDNQFFKTGSQQTLRNSSEFTQPYESGFSPTVASNSNDRLSGTDDEDIRSPATTMSDSSMNTSLANLPEWMAKGESVRLKQTNHSGKIAFIGPTEFATGIWIGIELDSAIGKNDGSVKGVRYFETAKKRGKFVRPDKVVVDRSRRGSGSRFSGSSRMSQSLTTSSLSAMAAAPHDSSPGFKMPRSSSRGRLSSLSKKQTWK